MTAGKWLARGRAKRFGGAIPDIGGKLWLFADAMSVASHRPRFDALLAPYEPLSFLLPLATLTPTSIEMPALLLVVFLVELAVHLVNTIGAASINNLVCEVIPGKKQRPARLSASKGDKTS
jgi:hypothetical protein